MTISSQRPVRARAALAALGLLLALLGPERPVWASTDSIVVTMPTEGAVLSAAAPITVNWTSAPNGGPVGVKLQTPGLPTGFFITGNVPNTGQYTFTLPDSFPCDPQADYQVRVWRSLSGYAGVSGSFRIVCPLLITKQVVNTTGRPASGTFRMRVQCEPGSQTFADIAGSGQGSFTRKVHVPPGSTVCTVQETGMPLPPRGCNWLTTYPGGQQRAPGGPAVVVVNTLQCGPATPPGPRR